MTADPVEGYLDRLLAHLRGSAHDVRRILSETEEHLRDATAELVAAGASEEDAQRRAIERFGDPRTVARRFSARLAPVPPAAVVGELARAAVLLGAVGLVAIGASGALAELLGRLFGPAFVAGDLPGVTYTAQRCAEFLEYFPDAGGCEQAAAMHHWGEVVEYRVAAGVLGLLVLGAFLLWRPRRRGQGPHPGEPGLAPGRRRQRDRPVAQRRDRGLGDGGGVRDLAVRHRAHSSPARPRHLPARPGRALLQLANHVGLLPTGSIPVAPDGGA